MAKLKRRIIREKKPQAPSPAETPDGNAAAAQPSNNPVDATAEPVSAPVQVNGIDTDAGPQATLPEESRHIGTPVPGRKLSFVQITLIAGIILSAALLTYSLVESPSGKKTPQQANAAQSPPPVAETDQTPTAKEDTRSPASQPGEPLAAKTEPLSLQLVENYYAAKDYESAYNVCERLRQNLTSGNFELVRDFLQLRMALCLEHRSYPDKANQLFKAVSESPSVTLKTLANYHCSLLEMNAGQYLNARTRAYKTIALTAACTFDSEWAMGIERDCQFLAAEAITRQVLSLCDADKDLPKQLWSKPNEKDPLAGLNETQLQAALNAGTEQLNSGLLAPQIRAMETSPGVTGMNRWSIICNGPGIEELMARFAANTALDVKWVRPVEQPDAKRGKIESRPAPGGAGLNRSVTLCLPAATTQQAASIAAGAVGLLAQIDTSGIITITDPTEYSTLSEHTRMLNEQAIWLWRKLLLTYSDDQRIPNAHFILGVLQSHSQQVAEAIAEYKITANRYSRTALAPFALLRSSRLKTDLRDYAGAGRDLKQLIEQYPENELVGQAHIDLAETTMKAGLYDEACSLYKKAYNLGFSTESKPTAALGAGKCFYQMKDYDSAIKWLTRYLEAVGTQATPAAGATDNNLYAAYLLLGKANLALGNLQAACDNLQLTMRRAAASDEYVEAVSSLVETQIKQQDYVAALDTIENVRAWPFSQEQLTRLLLLKSCVLRSIGLADQAITLLADRAQYLTDPRLKAGIILELARCNVAKQNLDVARAHLIEVISLVEPGPVAWQASVELAEVCLKLGEYRQTVSICTQLLDSSAPEQTKQQCSKILASAYSKEHDYDKAAESLLTASVLPETERK